MFEGFRTLRIETSGAAINLRIGGDGPPVLLLHGYPQSHVMWHKVAPGLSEHFTVVAPDLRGYGDSSKPPSGADHGGDRRVDLGVGGGETLGEVAGVRPRALGLRTLRHDGISALPFR